MLRTLSLLTCVSLFAVSLAGCQRGGAMAEEDGTKAPSGCCPAKPCCPAEATPLSPVADHSQPAEKPKEEDRFKKRDLFDGKTLKGWKKTEFGGEGEVEVKDGMIVMDLGNDMTGVTYDGKPPLDNYEFTFEGQRLAGSDFFCSATFPVAKEHCTLVVGGWGGSVVGLSCVDGYDASDNPTTKFMTFKDNKWYKVRIRVCEPRVEAWIDDEQVVDIERKDHKFSTRFECDPCKPLGFATWQTKGAVRAIAVRELTPDEVKELKAEKRGE